MMMRLINVCCHSLLSRFPKFSSTKFESIKYQFLRNVRDVLGNLCAKRYLLGDLWDFG
jgi:hypothetical protein